MNYHFRKVKKLASVLNSLAINTFFHLRINTKSQFFILSNNAGISNHLINEDSNVGILHNKLATTSISGKISIAIWKKYVDDSFLEKIYKMGVWNGISIALPFDDYIDIFSFASSIENKHVNNLYLNHLRLIKRFIIFFRLNAKDTIEYANQHLYQLNNKLELYTQCNEAEKRDLIDNIRKKIQPRKAFIKTLYTKKISLTEREVSYLIMLLDGKSMLSIAEELGISQRSVESCFETIKSKTGYSTKAELLTAFFESQIYQPSVYYDRYN